MARGMRMQEMDHPHMCRQQMDHIWIQPTGDLAHALLEQGKMYHQYWRKNMGIRRIKQGSVKNRRPKVDNIAYNTVAPCYILNISCKIYIYILTVLYIRNKIPFHVDFFNADR